MMSQNEVPFHRISEKGMLSCEGMGSESRVPSGRMGLACSPLALSKPFLLRMIFMGRERMLDGCWSALVKSPLRRKVAVVLQQIGKGLLVELVVL